MAGPRHLDALTGIRGIAAWGVVLYHIRLSLVTLLPAPAIAALGKGYLAVDLFFILSGFVIWYNYAERIAAGGSAEVRLFLWRRFARVWPLHAVVLSGFAALALLLAATGRDTHGYPWGELPLHVLLMQNWGFTADLSWNHPAWSISTEFAAYLAFPLMVALFRAGRITVGALCASAVAICGALSLLFALLGYASLGDDIPGMGLWRCLAGFALGCILCQLWQRWNAVPRGGVFAGIAAAVIALLGVLSGLSETVWVPPAFFAGLLALALGRGAIVRVLGSKALTWLGEVSYSTYLSHYFLFILFKLAFVDASLQLGWVGLGGYLALVLAASAVLYQTIEKPAQRWLNARTPQRLVARPPLPAE